MGIRIRSLQGVQIISDAPTQNHAVLDATPLWLVKVALGYVLAVTGKFQCVRYVMVKCANAHQLGTGDVVTIGVKKASRPVPIKRTGLNSRSRLMMKKYQPSVSLPS